jgi:ADP-ribose pyrophosphatase
VIDHDNIQATEQSQQQIYQGQIITLSLESVILPNNQAMTFEIVHHPGGAAIIAMDQQQQICLIRQYRHAAQAWLWELPAGKRETTDSDPLITAQRELVEEAGLSATQWQSLGFVYSSPGVFDEKIFLFLATELSHGEVNHDHGEIIKIHWCPLAQALSWCHDGTIQDAKTIIGLQRADHIFQNQVAR